jgi:integrase
MNTILKKASLPKLYCANGNVERLWYVYYSFYNHATGKMQRIKQYKGINEFTDKNQRFEAAKKIADELTLKLQRGYNPFIKEENLYFPVTAFVKQPRIKKDKSKTVDYYLDLAYSLKESQLRQKSKAKYKSQIRKFCYWLDENGHKNIDILEVTKTMCNDFLNHIQHQSKTKSATTRNDYLVNLKGFFKMLVEDEIIRHNPFEKIKKIRELRTGALPFNPPQIETIKSYLYQNNLQMWVMLQMQYYCFIRPGECRDLKVEHIDFYTNTITIPGTISKNHETQTVKIPKPFVQPLYEYCATCSNLEYFVFGTDGTPGPQQVSRDYFTKRHRAMLDELNISKRHKLYSWKHTGAKRAVLSGMNIKQLQIQLRHKDLETVDIYLRSLGVNECEDIYNNFPSI